MKKKKDPRIDALQSQIDLRSKTAGGADVSQLTLALDLQTKLERLRLLRHSSWVSRSLTPVTGTIMVAAIALLGALVGAYVQKTTYSAYFKTEIAKIVIGSSDSHKLMAQKLIMLHKADLIQLTPKGREFVEKVAFRETP